MKACNCSITDAEMQVMNILWEKEESTSKEISGILEKRNGWSNTTVKTLLSRLVEKDVVATRKQSNYFIYSPNVEKRLIIHDHAIEVSEKICSKSMGAFIHDLIINNELSSKDIKKLLKDLNEKEANDNIVCNCVSDN